ncbi:MAG: prepilin-type N-terminal cleavage/methylation domain-containing protein [Phycisphaerales bacterium]|nr:prepilin-type N-terminal cleavage/methylation domain-containing protein [Planctomycetota bacterium]MCH8509325.1 prepilin-type N-terminal cleavage/methylation domain-containing protein [Phycisphaerales bacterium]
MRRGFTLIELLVVIAIIAILMGILIPAIGAARRTAQSAVGNANLRTMSQVLVIYTQQNQDAFLNPFGHGKQYNDQGALDYNDALSTDKVTRWNFNAHPITPQCTTEYFAVYWYSYLAELDGQSRIREEQIAPADATLVSLARDMRNRREMLRQELLWPSSYLLSPTLWSDSARYPGGARLPMDAPFVRTQTLSAVTYPERKVLVWERMDFLQRERSLMCDEDAGRTEPMPPAWNNLRANPAVALSDGSVRKVQMSRLYEAASQDHSLNPSGGVSVPDELHILGNEAGEDIVPGYGRLGGSDLNYPAFFWATRHGVRGRDLAP